MGKKLTDVTIKLAAYLHCRGVPQKQAVTLLATPQPTLSHAKEIAKENGWLLPPRMNLPLQEIEELEQQLYAEDLKKKLVAEQRDEKHLHLSLIHI